MGDVGGVDVFGFVEKDVNPAFALSGAEFDGFAIHFDFVDGRIDQDGEIGDDSAVEGDAALPNHFLDVAPGVNAGVRQDFLDSLFQFRSWRVRNLIF